MKFEEPKVELVALETEVFTTQGSGCTDSTTCVEYGVETCMGVAPMNSCTTDDNWL